MPTLARTVGSAHHTKTSAADRAVLWHRTIGLAGDRGPGCRWRRQPGFQADLACRSGVFRPRRPPPGRWLTSRPRHPGPGTARCTPANSAPPPTKLARGDTDPAARPPPRVSSRASAALYDEAWPTAALCADFTPTAGPRAGGPRSPGRRPARPSNGRWRWTTAKALSSSTDAPPRPRPQRRPRPGRPVWSPAPWSCVPTYAAAPPPARPVVVGPQNQTGPARAASPRPGRQLAQTTGTPCGGRSYVYGERGKDRTAERGRGKQPPGKRGGREVCEGGQKK